MSTIESMRLIRDILMWKRKGLPRQRRPKMVVKEPHITNPKLLPQNMEMMEKLLLNQVREIPKSNPKIIKVLIWDKDKDTLTPKEVK